MKSGAAGVRVCGVCVFRVGEEELVLYKWGYYLWL